MSEIQDVTGRINDVIAALGEDALVQYRTAFEQSLLILKAQAQLNAPVGIGGGAGLRGSIEASPVAIGVGEISGAVGTSIGHALPVELGTRPHFPPLQPLIDWVEYKLGIDEEHGGVGVALKIQRKIGAKGTAPQPFMGTAFESHADNVAAIFQATTDRLLREVSNGD